MIELLPFFGGGSGLKSTWLPVITVSLNLILWQKKKKNKKAHFFGVSMNSKIQVWVKPYRKTQCILDMSFPFRLKWLNFCHSWYLPRSQSFLIFMAKVLLIMLPFLADLLPSNLRLLSFFVLEFLQTPKPWQAREFISASELGQHHKFCHIPGQWSQGWKGELN